MNQNLLNTILLSLAFVAMVIGAHRSLEEDIASNYWIIMIGLMLFILYLYRKKRQGESK
jgi:hypothetical protein